MSTRHPVAGRVRTLVPGKRSRFSVCREPVEGRNSGWLFARRLPGADMEEWRQCGRWLIDCKVLPPNHRVVWPSAAVFDLAQALRDGVLLCQMLHNLSPGSVDLKEINFRPQMSQVSPPTPLQRVRVHVLWHVFTHLALCRWHIPFISLWLIFFLHFSFFLQKPCHNNTASWPWSARSLAFLQ